MSQPIFFGSNSYTPGCGEAVIRGLLDDILTPVAMVSSLFENPEYLRDLNTALRQSVAPQRSEVTSDKDKFHANFDVQHFKPEEITVKVTGDNTVMVEAKHEEKEDEHGQVFRHVIRKYVLPKNCDLNKLESKLSTNGVLSISAPIIDDNSGYRTIPIVQTEKPAASIGETNPENDQQNS